MNPFNFSRTDRRAAWVLIVFLILLTVVSLALNFVPNGASEAATDQEELTLFIQSLQQKEKERSFQYASKRTPLEEEPTPVLVPFDPNTADSLQLRRLGLPKHVVRSILNYRAHGGVFRTVESFSKIYTLSAEQYHTLKPYIRIPVEAQPYLTNTQEVRDTLRTVYPVKFTTDTILDLNRVDTTLLQRVPGIGSVFARAIVERRQKLGGYYRVEQLAEVKNSSPDWYRWFAVKTPPQQTVKVNRWSVEHLREHPYISFYQARKIVECRKKYGKLTNLSQLAFYDEFSEQDLERLRPYVDFSD